MHLNEFLTSSEHTSKANSSLDWTAATRELVSQCAALDNREARISLLEKFCIRLGDQLYPAFLRLLCILELRGDEPARKLLANTLAFGLTTGRIPSGQLPAWGSVHPAAARNPFARARTLGPIEFLCAWYTQPTQFATLDERSFRDCLSTLLRLISIDTEAANLYAGKLINDTGDPLSGLLSSRTREGLHELASAWQSGIDLADLPAVYLSSSHTESGLQALIDVRQQFRT